MSRNEKTSEQRGKFNALVRLASKRWNRRFRYDLLRAKIGQRYNCWMIYVNYMTDENAQKLLVINYHASTRLRRLGERWGYLQKWEKELIKQDRSNKEITRRTK